MFLLLIIYMKKKTYEKGKTDEILKLRACYLQFALELHENALIFRQLEARHFSCTSLTR